jgi:hypothetical protein
MKKNISVPTNSYYFKKVKTTDSETVGGNKQQNQIVCWEKSELRKWKAELLN